MSKTPCVFLFCSVSRLVCIVNSSFVNLTLTVYLSSGGTDRQRMNRIMVVRIACIARRHRACRLCGRDRFAAPSNAVVPAKRPILRLLKKNEVCLYFKFEKNGLICIRMRYKSMYLKDLFAISFTFDFRLNLFNAKFGNETSSSSISVKNAAITFCCCVLWLFVRLAGTSSPRTLFSSLKNGIKIK